MLLITVSDGKCSVQVERVVMDKQEIGSGAVIHPTSVLEIVKSMWLQTKPLFQRPNLSLTIVACLMQFALYARYSFLCHDAYRNQWSLSGNISWHDICPPVIKAERSYLRFFFIFFFKQFQWIRPVAARFVQPSRGVL